MPSFNLQGATAVVTGASRGIGPYVASALAERGAKVALVARSRQDLDAVARELERRGATALAVAADLTSSEQRRAAIETIESSFGVIDVLVNNAGGDPQREFHRLSADDVLGVLELNLTSVVMLTHLVLPGMLERGRGHVVGVSSMAGRTSFPLTETYAAAKDGVLAFTRVLRADYRRRGVSASALILGPVREAGVGSRTAEQVGIKLPPKLFTVAPEAVGRATVRAIVHDRAEVVVLNGPGRTLRAVMDRFPGLGPAMNRMSGAEQTMRTVAEFREREVQLALEP